MRWCSCSTRRFRRGSRGRNTSWPTSWRNGLNAARTSWPSPSRCSDGQRFPAKGKSITARALSRYFADEGLSTYTHLTDQHAVYGTKVIVATDHEAPYVLDEILGNQTDLPITEHATDTHGASLLNFALFDLCGLQLSPRIRDLGKITLYRARGRGEVCAQFPVAG